MFPLLQRKQYKTCLETLTQRMAQFRCIERRLLTRFKDKTPVPLTNLDMLLEGTHKQVQASCDMVQEASREEERVGSNLGCIVRCSYTQLKYLLKINISDCC